MVQHKPLAWALIHQFNRCRKLLWIDQQIVNKIVTSERLHSTDEVGMQDKAIIRFILHTCRTAFSDGDCTKGSSTSESRSLFSGTQPRRLRSTDSTQQTATTRVSLQPSAELAPRPRHRCRKKCRGHGDVRARSLVSNKPWRRRSMGTQLDRIAKNDGERRFVSR